MKICAWAPGTFRASRVAEGAGAARGIGGRHRRRGQRPEEALGPGEDVRRLDVAAHREHHPARHVVAPVVGDERRAVHPLEALLEPARLPGIGIVAEGAREQGVEGDVVGLLAAISDLPHQEVAHGLQGAVGQGRCERDLGDEVEHLRPVAVQRGGGKLGEVRVAVRLDAAPHAVRRLDDLRAVELVRAPHHHDLEEVRDARRPARLPARAHLHHEGHRDDGRHRVLAHQDGHAIGEPGAGDGARLGGGGQGGEADEGGGEEGAAQHGRAAARHGFFGTKPTWA